MAGTLEEPAKLLHEGELSHLLGCRLSQLLTPVAYVNVPQAGQGIDVFTSVGVLEHDSLTLNPHVGRCMVSGVIEGMQQMFAIVRH